jgi:hypothetical protein
MINGMTFVNVMPEPGVSKAMHNANNPKNQDVVTFVPDTTKNFSNALCLVDARVGTKIVMRIAPLNTMTTTKNTLLTDYG